MSAGTLCFAHACLTDPGSVRLVNEDCYVARPDAGFWAVADGMGGHEHGQWASHAIAAELEAVPLGTGFDADAATVAEALHAAHGTIHSEGHARGATMGSTVAALLIAEGRFAVFWTGDSRIYRMRRRALEQLTHDHTHVAAMVERGLISAEDARRHPLAHVLSHAVGAGPELALDRVDGLAAPGDIFLLCSDGLSGPVADAEIETRLSEASPRGAVDSMARLCLDRGAPDNLTAVVVRCDEVTQAAFAC